MTAKTATLAGRRQAQSIMVDSCVILRYGLVPVTNPETGTVTPSSVAEVYGGQCRISQSVKNARPYTVGEAQEWLIRLQLQLPVTATGVQINDHVTIVATVLDPDLVGKTFVIREIAAGTHITSRRLQMEEIGG